MKFVRWIPLAFVGLYLAIPLFATVVYALSTSWNHTVFPEGLTLKWILALFQDKEFLLAFGRSVLLSAGAVLLSIVLVVPAICMIVLYFPQYEKWIKAIIVMIYSFPGIILSVGLLKFYSATFIPLVAVVVGVYCVIILPYLYQGTKNNLMTINGRQLMDAAELLGANKWYSFRKILMPSIYPGLFVATLLSFSILFGEFVLINLIVGSKFKTLQVFLVEQLNTSGHLASAVVFIYVLLMAMLTFSVMQLSTRTKGANAK